jgi:hypothetical protein
LAGQRRPVLSEVDREIGRTIIARAIGGMPSRPSRNHPDRFANLALGTLFSLVGVAPFVAFAWLVHNPFDSAGLRALGLIGAIFVPICLLGLSMMIQGVRNRPGLEGFFYRGLFWLSDRVTPLQATVAPLAVTLAVAMQGLAAHDIVTLTRSIHFALIWTSFFAQLFLHELGHLIAVRRARLPFLRLVAGPLKLVPQGSLYRFGTNRQWIHVFAGAVFYELNSAPSARKAFWVAAAGPIATACAGVLALVVRVGYETDKESLTGSIIYGFASANAAIAVILLVTNLLPFRLGRFESDGFQMWRAFRARG